MSVVEGFAFISYCYKFEPSMPMRITMSIPYLIRTLNKPSERGSCWIPMERRKFVFVFLFVAVEV